jgi:hypothetical protein
MYVNALISMYCLYVAVIGVYCRCSGDNKWRESEEAFQDCRESQRTAAQGDTEYSFPVILMPGNAENVMP